MCMNLMIYCIYSLSSFTVQLCLIIMSTFNRAPWSHGQFAPHLEVRFTAYSSGGDLGYQYPLLLSISLQSTVFVLSLGSSQPVQTLGKVPLPDDEFVYLHWCLYWSYQFTLCLHGQLALNLIGLSHCLETFATNTYLPFPPSPHQLYCCITLDYLNLFHL